jgi:hypothetical protein
VAGDQSRVCDSGFFVATLADDEELLRSTSGFKNGTRNFSLFPSCSLAGSIAPKGDRNLSSVVTHGSVCSLTCGWKSKLKRPVYIGVLVPTHRGLGVLPILSPSWLQIAVDMEKLGMG